MIFIRAKEEEALASESFACGGGSRTGGTAPRYLLTFSLTIFGV